MSPLIPYAAIACTVIALIPIIMSFLRSKNHFPVSNRTVIITGGSQGLGLALAQKLAAKGANIVIIAQDVPKLERALASIQTHAINSSQRFLQLSFDLRSPDSAPKIFEQVTAWNNGQPPDIVWNAAGYCHPAFFADASIETLRDQMDTVFWSSAYIAHAALNLWKKPKSSLEQKTPSSSPLPSRQIIFTSSVLAFFPVAGYTPYTCSKVAMKALAESLHHEVAVYNGAYSRNDEKSPAAEINVKILYPVGIRTPGFDNEEKWKPDITKKLEEDDKPQDPAEVAEIAIRKLEAGEHSITTNFLGHLMRGCGMGASPRRGIVDLFWNWLGSTAVIFVAPDFISKCRAWGKSYGMRTLPGET